MQIALLCTRSLFDIKNAGMRQVCCVWSCQLNLPSSHQSRCGKDVSFFNWLGIGLSETAYVIMSGRLSPSGIFKELLAGTRGGRNGTLGAGEPERVGKERRGRIDPTHSASTQLGVRDDEAEIV